MAQIESECLNLEPPSSVNTFSANVTEEKQDDLAKDDSDVVVPPQDKSEATAQEQSNPSNATPKSVTEHPLSTSEEVNIHLVEKIADAEISESRSVKSAPLASKGGAATSQGVKATNAVVKKTPTSSTTLKNVSPFKPGTQKPASGTAKVPMSNSKAANSLALPPSVSTATRRTSMAPKNTSTKIMSSTNTISGSHPTTNVTRTATTSPQESVVSKTGTTRPRASVSDGLPARRATLSSRPSIPTSAKPPLTKHTRTAGTASITSLKEVKEDDAAIDDLQKKLAEAESSLASRNASFTSLESELESLKNTSKDYSEDVETKTLQMNELRQQKDVIEGELQIVKALIDSLTAEKQEAASEMQSVRAELEAIQIINSSNSELIKDLKAEIEKRSSEVEDVQMNLSALQAAASAAESASTEALSKEREAFAKIEASLNATIAENKTLRASLSVDLEEARAKLKEFEAKGSSVESLTAEITQLKLGREEMMSKISELEIEILELKEAAETSDDEKKSLEEKLKQALRDSQKLQNDMTQKIEHLQQDFDATRLDFEQKLQSEIGQQNELLSQQGQMRENLEAATLRYEQAVNDAKLAEEDNQKKVGEITRTHEEELAALKINLERLSDELNKQESIYAAKVNEVMVEHEDRLQRAFEKAKIEAGEIHTQELQELRIQSRNAIEQLQKSHHSTVEEMKTEHQSLLESELNRNEKKLSAITLDLKATQDDLLKAKTALSSSIAECQLLKSQLEEAKSTATTLAASSSAELSAEMDRIKGELISARDDRAALEDVLKVTKSSMEEMSRKHGVEIEEITQAHTEEVQKLSDVRKQETASWTSEKENLLSRISDLEGDLTTLRTSVAAEEPQQPKNNGLVPSGSSVTREELQQMHEAHNLKVHDLEAQYDKSLKSLGEEVDRSHRNSEQLQLEIQRRSMEVQFLEQEGEEKEDIITRLKEDVASLTEQLESVKASLASRADQQTS